MLGCRWFTLRRLQDVLLRLLRASIDWVLEYVMVMVAATATATVADSALLRTRRMPFVGFTLVSDEEEARLERQIGQLVRRGPLRRPESC